MTLWWERNREHINTYIRNRYRKHREFINSLKHFPCMDCGAALPPYCMDFDHVRGTKSCSVPEMTCASLVKIQEEVNKCDLVCANCHHIRTDSRRNRSKNPWQVRFYSKINLLKEHPCCDCGQIYPHAAMQFHHVRGNKVACISEMSQLKWDRVLKELDKCDLICDNCHRKRTWSKKVLVFAPIEQVQDAS